MAINRSKIRKELEPGLNALLGTEYNSYDDVGPRIYEVENSDRAFEEEVMKSYFGNASQKNEGGSVSFDESQETYVARYDHVTYALGFEITEEAMEDNLYRKEASDGVKALARSMAHTKQIETARLFNNAFTAGASAIGDGSAMCASDHSTLSGDQTNIFAVAQDLNETSLEDAIIQIEDYRDERDLKIAAVAADLIIPNQLQFVAHRLLQSNQRPSTTDNDTNAMRDMNIFNRDPVRMHFLEDPDAWFIKTDVRNGLKRFQRISMSTDMEGEFTTGNMRYKVRDRYSHGISDWRAIFGSPGA
jgi:hypothetical protein